MPGLVERACFLLCLALGRLLRSARYSETRIVHDDGKLEVRKRRSSHAPLLVWMGGPLVSVLDTGVRVLPQREWEERECRVYRSLGRAAVRIDAGGVLVLPCLGGATLATLLEDPALDESVRTRAIVLAVAALAAFHHLGLTHGDAMAENVMVDIESGVAHWLDFETAHDPDRPMAWRRADDVRALLASCLLRTGSERLAETLHLVLDVYADDDTTRRVAASFTPLVRRPLAFHLGQAALSLRASREIARLLGARVAEQAVGNAPRCRHRSGLDAVGNTSVIDLPGS